MAGADPVLIRLRRIVKSLDDEALAALANKGLLRRAQKDLEGARPRIVSTTDAQAVLEVGEATVTILELLPKSTCTCPATGNCRHILAALLYLRDDPSLAELDAPVQQALFEPDAAATAPDAALDSPVEVFGPLSEDDLQQWAGKSLLKKASKLLATPLQAEIQTEPALVIRFPSRNITCRWVPGTGLAGFVCSCKSQSVCEHVVCAVLAYQAQLGLRQIALLSPVLEESSGAPRTRSEVLASVGVVLREMVSLGLVRLSPATADRVTTLAVSAHGVDLPRLERALKSLADEVQLALRRDAQSSSTAMLVQAARVEALRTGLERAALPSLVGQHRSQYHDVGQLVLTGVGAQHWRSKGGYHGVTVYFWDESRGGWSTWTESRPVQQAGFDPVARFGADGPWAGCPSPREAARGVVRLSGAFRNSQGRLSGRPSTRAMVIGPSRPRELPGIVNDWSQLASRGQSIFGGGLGEQSENQELVLLAPQAWGPASYDDVRQELTRPIVDAQGRLLPLWLPFTSEHQSAVRVLEQHPPGPDDLVFGALRLVAGQLCVQPISIVHGNRILSLNLEQAVAATSQRPTRPTAVDDELPVDEPDDAVVISAGATPLGRIVISAQAEIEALAETGIAVRRNLELLIGAARRLDGLGLLACARPLTRLTAALANPAQLTAGEQRRQAAGELLRTYYVLQLAAERETVVTACSFFQPG